MKLIGPNHGSEILRRVLHDIHPDLESEPNFAIDTVFGEPGKQYDPDYTRKATGTLRTLVADHDELVLMDVPGQIAKLKQEVAALRARPFV